ncbi:hypothetical protein B7494_g4621 [Chlorociboria aeruginascens]|nr:hypothetical protein B7494_g4621 [Chlorociboria aeruginascens]
MASSVRMMIGRSAGLNHTGTSYALQSQTAAQERNATLALIQNLVFAESKSVRTSTIILAAFNVLAALTTACSIVYDCYWASKRCGPKFKASKFFMSSIHSAETFPLVIAIGVVVQGLVFAVVSGHGLDALFEHGCAVLSQFMWPALFIVPYLQLVFGLECAIRSLKRSPFQARGKYDVTICLVVVGLMLIGTWVPSHLHPEVDKCFASLVWFITRYGLEGFILLSVIAGLLIVSAITIFVRLSTVNLIDQHQRIAASRMVYYLVLGIIWLAFVIPWFASLAFGGGNIKLSMMATVVLNLSGLMTGLLQLFLRSNTAMTSFGPKSEGMYDPRKYHIRIWGPNELAFGNHLVDPVPRPELTDSRTSLMDIESRRSSRATLVAFEKGRFISMDALNSPTVESPMKYSPKALTMSPVSIPEPAMFSPQSRTHSRKQSYSLFPVSSPLKPATSNIPATPPSNNFPVLELPPRLHVSGILSRSPGHRRDSSIASSATVQIGLRLSHAPPSEEDIQNLPPALPSTIYNAANARPASPLPLKIQTHNLTPSSVPTRSPLRPSPLIYSTFSPSPEVTPIEVSPALEVNKTLPPTPKVGVPTNGFNIGTSQQDKLKLSPDVYEPEKRKSRRGSPLIVRQTPLKGTPLGSPSSPPPRPERSNSGGGRLPARGRENGQWI